MGEARFLQHKRASVAIGTDDRILSTCTGGQSCHSLRKIGVISQVALPNALAMHGNLRTFAKSMAREAKWY